MVVGAPLEFAEWAAQPGAAEAFAGVRYALSGSAPLTADLVAAFAGFGVDLFEGYGLTEAAPVVTVNLVPAESGGGWASPKPGSVGRPVPGVEVRLLDGDGEEVEVGDLGTLAVRGDNLFTGYWPDGEGGPGPDGWFATGDLAVADDDGDLYLVGRRGDLVLVNGFNVYPAEVEAVFAKLPGVREVAVLGVPDAGSGSDLIVAYLVAEPGAVLDPDALLEQAGSSLARFKLPRQLIEVDKLPHTATGKAVIEASWIPSTSRSPRHRCMKDFGEPSPNFCRQGLGQRLGIAPGQRGVERHLQRFVRRPTRPSPAP